MLKKIWYHTFGRKTLGPNQTKFLEALESGKYQQTFGTYRNEVGAFCAIGVAAEIGDFWSFPIYDQLPAVYAMPSDAGDRVIRMNDTQHKTFPEIAAAIRKSPRTFFSEPK